jgi:predicted RNA binding protein YcfA (HicA-like mRNA interferase family)
MGKFGNISGKEAVKVFQKLGWQKIGQVGSHVVMVKSGMKANLSIPQHKELSVRTLRALIRNAGLTVYALVIKNCRCECVAPTHQPEHITNGS